MTTRIALIPMRVLLRGSRIELLVATVIVAALSILATALAAQLRGLAPTPDCASLLRIGYTPEDLARCPGLVEFQALQGGPAFAVLLGLVIAVPALGVVLGSQLIAMETEQRTAALAWSSDPGRWHWVRDRILGGVVVVVVIGLPAVAATTVLAMALNPAVNLASSFDSYGMWGPVVVVRALAALSIGALVGSLIGRVLPSAIITTLIVVGLSAGGLTLAPLTFPATTVDSDTAPNSGAMVIASVVTDGSGAVLTVDEATARAPVELDPGEAVTWVYEHFRPASLIIPGDSMPQVAVREVAILGFAAMAALAGTAVVVQRRRPY